MKLFIFCFLLISCSPIYKGITYNQEKQSILFDNISDTIKINKALRHYRNRVVRYIGFRACNISQFPHEIYLFDSLQHIATFDVPILALPAEFAKLKNLESIVVYRGAIAGDSLISDSLRTLPKLKGLNVFGNPLTGADYEKLKKRFPFKIIFYLDKAL